MTDAAEKTKQVIARLGHGRMLMRRLPANLGGCVFPASLEGGSKFLRRDLNLADPVLTSFAKDYVKPGAAVWDIGANVGLFTFSAAGLSGSTGSVLAVEADTWLAGNLRRAVAKNLGRGAPVTVVPAAVSDSWGFAEFNIAANARATNYLTVGGGSSTTGGIRETQTVPTLPLDALLDEYGPPTVMKIDIEGAESLALRGASRLLAHRPLIMLEIIDVKQAELITDQLARFGYTYINAVTRKPCDLSAFNVIAISTG